MLINENRNPKLSSYYIGSLILEKLFEEKSISFDNLFDYIKSQIGFDFHVNFLYYSLDWLYLTSLVELNEAEVVLNDY